MKTSLLLALLCLGIPAEARGAGEAAGIAELHAVPESLGMESTSLPQAFVPDPSSLLRPWFPDVVGASRHPGIVPSFGASISSNARRDGDRIAALIHEKYRSYRESLSAP